MTQMLPLKYLGYSVVFQEVPDEISLAINISGCPVKCKDCHSKYLWEYKGSYLKQDIYALLSRYRDYVSCICFMGGNQNLNDLECCCDIVHGAGLKTCLYTGYTLSDKLKQFALKNLDYIKVGDYRADLGGLSSRTTNQRMYKIEDGELKDITETFWKVKERMM